MATESPVMVVELVRPLTAPRGWGEKTNRDPMNYVWCETVEPTADGDAYELYFTAGSDSWVIPKRDVADVRPPPHPGHPANF